MTNEGVMATIKVPEETLAQVKRYIGKRLNTAISKKSLPKGKYTFDDVIDQLFINVYDHFDEVKTAKELHPWLFKKADELMEDWIIEEEFDELFFIKSLDSDVPIAIQLKPNATIKVKSKLPDLHDNLKIKGSSGSEFANEFLYKMSSYKISIAETEEKLYKDETADGQYYYDSIIQSISAESKQYLKNRISNESNSSILFLALDFIDYEQDYEDLLMLESKLKENYSHTQGYQKIKKSIFK